MKRNSLIGLRYRVLATDNQASLVQASLVLCRGKAYFTTPRTLGQYLLADYRGMVGCGNC